VGCEKSKILIDFIKPTVKLVVSVFLPNIILVTASGVVVVHDVDSVPVIRITVSQYVRRQNVDVRAAVLCSSLLY